jgi:hypothetical protein
MKRCLAFPISLWLALAIFNGQQLPKPAGESFEVEPPLLVPEPRDPGQAGDGKSVSSAAAAELMQQLEHAKNNAASAERLYKAGVLARVDAEKRALQVVRLQADLAAAQLAEARESLVRPKGQVEIGQTSGKRSTDPRLASYAAAAEKAAADLRRAEIAAAELNVRRQQKLLALGSARKSDVRRAQEKLAALKQD